MSSDRCLGPRKTSAAPRSPRNSSQPRFHRGGTGGLHYPGESHTLDNNPNVKLLNNQRGYQLFTVTPDRWLAEVKVLDQVDRPGGTISTLARFVVDPKLPGPQTA